MDDAAVEVKRVEVARLMKALGDRLESGDESQLLVWVIPNALACAHRPLRHHPRYGGSGQPIPASTKPLVLDWIDQIRANGIASIISFMHDRDLRCYSDIDLNGLNLREFLERCGFVVSAVPWEDPHHKRTDPVTKRRTLERCRAAALEAFDRLPKPVLLQCRHRPFRAGCGVHLVETGGSPCVRWAFSFVKAEQTPCPDQTPLRGWSNQACSVTRSGAPRSCSSVDPRAKAGLMRPNWHAGETALKR